MQDKSTTYRDPFASKWSAEKDVNRGISQNQKKKNENAAQAKAQRFPVGSAPAWVMELPEGKPVTLDDQEPHPVERNANGTRKRGSKAEREFIATLETAHVAQRRSGYPDFAILDTANGVPIGFVEVKRHAHDERRYDQIAFERFCENFGVPYFCWWPGKPFPQWLQAMVNKTILLPQTPVLQAGQTAGSAYVGKRRRAKWAKRGRNTALRGPITALV